MSGAAERLGLSREMGALIAGLSISTFPYGSDVISKVTGVRDFFVTLFFVALGMKIPVPTAAVLVQAALIVRLRLREPPRRHRAHDATPCATGSTRAPSPR